MSQKSPHKSPQGSPIATISDRDVLERLTSPSGEPYDKKRSRFSGNIILPKLSNQSIESVKCSLYSTPMDDTVHYMSPATTSPVSARTVDEGDLYGYVYKSPSFMRYLHAFGRAPEASYISSSISCVEPEMQVTMAIVKPDYMKYEDVVMRAINEAGFTIIRKRYIHLTPEQVSEIYSQHYGSAAFPHMVVSMSAGPILSLCLGAVNAVAKWKSMVGPERTLRAEWFFPMSMRVRFGLQDSIPGALYASETLSEANKENRYVNHDSILEPIIFEENQVQDYCNMYINPTLLNGLAEVVRVKPVDPILHLADWLLRNNPYQPRYPQDITVLPT